MPRFVRVCRSWKVGDCVDFLTGLYDPESYFKSQIFQLLDSERILTVFKSKTCITKSFKYLFQNVNDCLPVIWRYYYVVQINIHHPIALKSRNTKFIAFWKILGASYKPKGIYSNLAVVLDSTSYPSTGMEQYSMFSGLNSVNVNISIGFSDGWYCGLIRISNGVQLSNHRSIGNSAVSHIGDSHEYIWRSWIYKTGFRSFSTVCISARNAVLGGFAGYPKLFDVVEIHTRCMHIVVSDNHV